MLPAARNALGLLLAIITGLSYTVATAAIQELQYRGYGVIQLSAMLHILYIPHIPVFSNITRANWKLPPMKYFWILVRTISSVVANILLFHSTSYLPLGEVSIFLSISVPLTALCSACLLHERVKPLNIITLFLTMSGATLLMFPAVMTLITKSSWNTVFGGSFCIGAAILYTSANLAYCYALRDVYIWSVFQLVALVYVLCGIIMTFVNWEMLYVCTTSDRLLVLLASSSLLYCALFTNLALFFTTAGLAAQTYFATQLITSFAIQSVLGSAVTRWSGSGAACTGVALIINLSYYGRELYQSRQNKSAHHKRET